MEDPLGDQVRLDCLVRLKAGEGADLYDVLCDLWTRFPGVRERELEARAAIQTSILRLADSGVSIRWSDPASTAQAASIPVAELPHVLEWVEVWRPSRRTLSLRLVSDADDVAPCLGWRSTEPPQPPSGPLSDPRLWLLASPRDLEGTAYVELLPGTYAGHCWQTGSLFLTEERWGHIEPIVERHVPGYDHYGFTEVPALRWSQVTSDLDRLAELLRRGATQAELATNVGFYFTSSEAAFMRDGPTNSARLAEMATQLAGWVRRRLTERPSITILGL